MLCTEVKKRKEKKNPTTYPGISLSNCFQLGKASTCQHQIEARLVCTQLPFTSLIEALGIRFSLLYVHIKIFIPITLQKGHAILSGSLQRLEPKKVITKMSFSYDSIKVLISSGVHLINYKIVLYASPSSCCKSY